MQRLLRVLFACAVLAALVVGPARTTSCMDVLEWGGGTYHGIGEIGFRAQSTGTLILGDRLGRGTLPPCDEARLGCAANDPATLTVLRVQGADPEIAVGVADDSRVYVAPGYVGADPRHPLHDVLYGPRQRTRERRGWTCGAASQHLATAGAVEFQPALRLDDGAGFARLESRTTFVGLDRNGVAYLEDGQPLSVQTLTCRSERGRTKLVAERVAPLEER